jgi:hypothetical protein
VRGSQRRLPIVALFHSNVAGVKLDFLLLPMQQGRRLTDAAHVGCRRHQRVNQPELLVDADLRLQAEMPLVAVLRLVNFRVARMVLILRRTWRGNQDGIDQRAFAHQEPALGERRVDFD